MGNKKHISEKKKAFIKLIILIVIVIIYIYVSTNIISVNFVSGNSMYPFVSNNGVVLTQKNNYSIQRYDVVLASVPFADTDIDSVRQIAIKRVIGVPYDTIKIIDGYIYINDEKLEKYNYYINDYGILANEITLGENEFFLMGDNREISYDSRFYGIVKTENIIGKIIKIVMKGMNEDV